MHGRAFLTLLVTPPHCFHFTQVDGLTGALNILPKYVTSNDNVLADTLTISPAKQPQCASPCGGSSSRPASRPHSPEITLKAQKALKGHLMIGSLLPEAESASESEEEDEQQEEAEENVRQLGVMAAAEAAYLQAFAKEEQVMADYPHGAPVSLYGFSFVMLVWNQDMTLDLDATSWTLCSNVVCVAGGGTCCACSMRHPECGAAGHVG
jgi:hypothetical protein